MSRVITKRKRSEDGLGDEEQGRPTKQARIDFDRVIRFHIGRPECDHRTFIVPLNLLAARSPFFTRAWASRVKSGDIYLSDQQPDVFKHYVELLYTHEISALRSSSTPTERMVRIVKLHLLGSKLEDAELMFLAEDELKDALRSNRPSVRAIDLAYGSDAISNVPLRRTFVKHAAKNCWPAMVTSKHVCTMIHKREFLMEVEAEFLARQSNRLRIAARPLDVHYYNALNQEYLVYDS